MDNEEKLAKRMRRRKQVSEWVWSSGGDPRRGGWSRSEDFKLLRFCGLLLAYMLIAMTVVYTILGDPTGILLSFVILPPIFLSPYLVVRNRKLRTERMAWKYYEDRKGASAAIGNALLGKGIDYTHQDPSGWNELEAHLYDDVFVIEENGLEIVVLKDPKTVVHVGPDTFWNKKEIERFKALIDKAMM